MRRLTLLSLVLVLAAALATPAEAATTGTDRRAYAAAVEQARALVEEALNGRSGAAPQALESLRSVGADADLPEVTRDLEQNPPDLADADRRLAAATAALSRPGDVSDPARARQQLNDILASDRYSYLRQAPLNPLLSFLNSLLSAFLGWLSRQQVGAPGLPAVPTWIWLVILGAVIVAAAGVAFAQLKGVRLPRWRRRRSRAGEPPSSSVVARHAEDRFSAADRLAGAGDHTAALRSLMAGVATELSGRLFWEQSPLTLRELFRETGRLEQLRPLLIAFERAVYGGGDVTLEAYEECARLAQPFRRQRAEGEAA